MPLDPVEQYAESDAEGTGQLGGGVDSRNPTAPLKQSDLGPVQPGLEAQLLLCDA
jgi:hypothetical protein